MKWIRWIDTAVAVAIVALVFIARTPVTVFAVGNCGSVACGTGFNGSYHDFVNGPGASHYGTVNLNGTNTTVGQCTLCHTPHSAIMTTLLWNHHLSNNTAFTWDVNSTMAGTPYAIIQNNWAGPTTKCLSCHDGSVSPDTINWFEGQTPIAGAPGCTTTAGVTTCSHPPVAGFMGQMGVYTSTSSGGGGVTGGGTHPVAMPFPCGGVQNTYDGVTTGAQIVAAEWKTEPAPPIRLYTQTAGTISRSPQGACTGTNNGIECSSCHDVHNRENVDIDLLRGYVSGASGYICQNCHNK